MAETIVVTVRGVTIKTTLYGTITPERLAKERAITEHRADQLAPPPPAEPWWLRDDPADEEEDEDDY